MTTNGFYIKNLDLKKAIDRVTLNGATHVKPNISWEIKKVKQLQYLRQQGLLLIGHDKRAQLSILYLKPGVNLLKVEDRYLISYLKKKHL